jgi:hypothetical protein
VLAPINLTSDSTVAEITHPTAPLGRKDQCLAAQNLGTNTESSSRWEVAAAKRPSVYRQVPAQKPPLVPDQHDDDQIEDRQHDQSEGVRVAVAIELVDDE